jgi:hypothetical protein
VSGADPVLNSLLLQKWKLIPASCPNREIAQLFKDGENGVFKGRSSKEVPADGFPEVNFSPISDTVKYLKASIADTITM